jgi:hypothetical protein
MLESAVFKPIAQSLYDALDRAELEVIGPTHHWDTHSQKTFRTWLWAEYGIAVGVNKTAIPGDNAAIERHVWELFGWRDDEQLLMFKLTYG